MTMDFEKLALANPMLMKHLTRAGIGAAAGAVGGAASAGEGHRIKGALGGGLVGGAVGGAGSVAAGAIKSAPAAGAKLPLPKAPTAAPAPPVAAPTRVPTAAPAPIAAKPPAPSIAPPPTRVPGTVSAAPTVAPPSRPAPPVSGTQTRQPPVSAAPSPGKPAPSASDKTPQFDVPAPVAAARAQAAAPPAGAVRMQNAGGKPRLPQAAANPTHASVANNELAYSQLPPDVRQMVESNPWRQKHGVEPRAMMQMAHWSAQPGEELAASLRRHISGLPKVAAFLKLANFAVSQYSGDLGPVGGPPYVSGMPPFRVEPFKKPKAKTAAAEELAKLCGVPLSPAARLSVAKGVGAPKVSAPSGPSIGDISKPTGFGMKIPGATKTAAEKTALIERLIRLGATDIPNTPRLVMKHRNPQELAALQHGVEGWWDKKVTQPIMGGAEKLYLNRMGDGKLKSALTQMTKWTAEDPIGAIATKATPVPFPVYAAGKKLLERGIDKAFPLPAVAAKAEGAAKLASSFLCQALEQIFADTETLSTN